MTKDRILEKQEKHCHWAAVTSLLCCGLLLLTATAARGKLTAAAKCEALKNKGTGKYALCLEKAEMKLVKTEGTCSGDNTTVCYLDTECASQSLGMCTKDQSKYNELVGKCDMKFSTNWDKWEAKAGGSCPTAGDETVVQIYLSDHSRRVATALVGDAPLGDPPLKTGQTAQFAAGDDGALEKGASRSYTDNGDGTITDNETGLMWEKKIELDNTKDGTNLHDADNTYPWGGSCSGEVDCASFGGTCCQTSADCISPDACTISDGQSTGLTIFGWVAQLNTESFAGHDDWRIPNQFELKTLVNFGKAFPSVDTAFEGASCSGACMDITSAQCSCTQPGRYWSSTTTQSLPNVPYSAWAVDFSFGNDIISSKSYGYYIRAVRGGF